MDKYKFGNRLYELRKANNITQEKLGKMLGVSNKAISKWENGESYPRLPMLDKIAECFNMSVDQLLEYDSEKTDYKTKKETKIDNPFEEFKPSAYTAKIMRDLGFIKTNDSEFISEIKKEYGFSNKELASILGVTQRTVGLWENGLKKPSARNSIKIAALYYKNCDTNEKINSFSNYTKHYNFDLIITVFGILFLFVFNIFFLFPATVSGDWALDTVFKSNNPSYRLSYLFLYVLPYCASFLICALTLRYTKINRPNISSVIKGIDNCRILIIAYYLVVLTVYSVSVSLTFVFGIYSLASFLFESVYNKKTSYNNKRILFALIPQYVFLVYLLFFADITFNELDAIPDSLMFSSYGLFNKNMTALLTVETVISFIFLASLSVILKDINSFSKAISVVFKTQSKEYTPLSKRDKVLFISGLVLICVFALIVIFNAKYYIDIFYG